ncbi:flagellar export chaperone FliS [Alicyclobacillus kakegawensis]|uniref:flagellar export chaperone FliS n=1 Tax=Alicyclobacillus kakegawensis TaxID=392012 RepID=UPI000831D6AB|nr:flagellar export chaperone FliS [Alicyclobacillus kakegawensis]
MTNPAYAAYRQASVQTASPDRLLIMLYDGLIAALENAKAALESGDVDVSHKQLMKAQSIIREGLWGPLDMRYEISKPLASLYQYFHQRLVEANLKKDVHPVVEVLDHIRGLRETWVEAAAKARQEQAQQLQG